MLRRNCYLVFILILLFACQDRAASKSGPEDERAEKIELTSSAFKDGEMIPKRFTCDDRDISPPLAWTSVPDGAKSIALICDDPDAPTGTWVHWVLYNLPPDLRGLPENLPPREILESGARQGMTDFRRVGYGGPCPPGGTHRYFFKLYALDVVIELEAGATKAELLEAMEGHVVGQGELVGKYSR